MSGSAARIVQERIRAQRDAARAHEEGVRTGGDPEDIHQMRVALRRLRSALVTFRPLFDREVTEPLREEVKWLAALLGGVRDTEVMQERMARVVSEEPDGADAVAARQLLEGRLDGDLGAARSELADAMGSVRYSVLMDGLDALAEQPPWAPDARDAGGALLRKRIRHDFDRMRDAVDAVGTAVSTAERDERLHEVRKAAKRVRYAAETVEARFGRPADRLAKAAEEVQEVLGEQHDAVTALALLRDAADGVRDEGGTSFALGRLHARTERASEDRIGEFDQAWKRARKPKLRRWLR